ncbi:hypothetical protein B9Z55_009856 [Caenorhabditis nigoni]|uniref:Uncharacterized protein n=1 Tax=Caenorhabditis nigoni TaxID=1611254 RepID=A0A2G5UUP6_9PELO|nr:hypothetical protein B9Z55_009856 [Caenorhabditis nigoni]
MSRNALDPDSTEFECPHFFFFLGNDVYRLGSLRPSASSYSMIDDVFFRSPFVSLSLSQSILTPFSYVFTPRKGQQDEGVPEGEASGIKWSQSGRSFRRERELRKSERIRWETGHCFSPRAILTGWGSTIRIRRTEMGASF